MKLHMVFSKDHAVFSGLYMIIHLEKTFDVCIYQCLSEDNLLLTWFKNINV